MALEEDICKHIFSASTGLVGVCLTVIGILRIAITVQKFDTFADEILAADAVLFLISCLLSYSALRKSSFHRMHRVERLADLVFIVAMCVMVFACLFIVFAIASS